MKGNNNNLTRNKTKACCHKTPSLDSSLVTVFGRKDVRSVSRYIYWLLEWSPEWLVGWSNETHACSIIVQHFSANNFCIANTRAVPSIMTRHCSWYQCRAGSILSPWRRDLKFRSLYKQQLFINYYPRLRKWAQRACLPSQHTQYDHHEWWERGQFYAC